jgi:hypothetical protein
MQREQLTLALRKRYGRGATVRESFQQQEGQVRFTLLLKAPPDHRWTPLIEVERPRLKTARQAAYDAALERARMTPGF